MGQFQYCPPEAGVAKVLPLLQISKSYGQSEIPPKKWTHRKGYVIIADKEMSNCRRKRSAKSTINHSKLKLCGLAGHPVRA